jgi:hypothetical protein
MFGCGGLIAWKVVDLRKLDFLTRQTAKETLKPLFSKPLSVNAPKP